MRAIRVATASALTGLLAACSGPADPTPTSSSISATPTSSSPVEASPSATPLPTSAAPATPREPVVTHTFTITEHESFDEPWAMAFLPGTDVLAVTEKSGRLKLRSSDGVIREVSGVPDVTVTSQGGFADIVPGPTFEQDGTVYLSWVEGNQGDTGGVVGRARLDVDAAALSGLETIWRQEPRGDREGHYSLRLAIHDDHLFVSSGDRQERSPAQRFDNDLGKVLRLTLDGAPAPGNPFQDEGAEARQFWSIGHRNPLGLAFDADGRLWSSEMGPQGGDEFNLIQAGLNYGWPKVSNGSGYDGSEIPDHEPGDGFEPPKVFWNPSVSPGSLMIYQGDLFPDWEGDAFIGALSGKALIRIDLFGEDAILAETWPMEDRIREVEQGSDGAIWLLEDRAGAKLLELRPS
ncbi:Glucose/arabinose dehydrogenase, beta-propeller fold [Tessaracoccus bendigoensis DSM 12906]|uniref:Glucose/arabinose dehydrogenase, beta-propeller fold n=1 Tax=Tessaracoccus bendigoensis DSM 12906 TaxID=1123357 RepID=A0A1M6EHI1_9ACTN|nr:PQQ-dependent sugar dehydrogenase [Tessaracoccus bendigoensis]SHI84957.1 Glucose/arabinose dehydrogenase, beta-propeller fold [Tessaracoccus bendigoensis DSM 12906]